MLKNLTLGEGSLRALRLMRLYRFLTIKQFGKAAGYSEYNARDVLRKLEAFGMVGYFGFTSIPGHGKTPKVYYVTRKGWGMLRHEYDDTPEYSAVHQETTWTPQMYHRLRLLDLFIALEMEVLKRPHLDITTTRLSYRRIQGTYTRETADFVDPLTKIIPDGAFVLENRDTGRRGLFFVEMDMATERIAVQSSKNTQATIIGKLANYDRYLTSGKFAATYAPYGEFRSFILLFVTYGEERIANIQQAASSLSPKLHGYYRFSTFGDANANFLGAVWRSRSAVDTLVYPIVQA